MDIYNELYEINQIININLTTHVINLNIIMYKLKKYLLMFNL